VGDELDGGAVTVESKVERRVECAGEPGKGEDGGAADSELRLRVAS
jgi:hypothetical protein